MHLVEFACEEGKKGVNATKIRIGVKKHSPHINVHCRVGERRIDVVNWDRVIRVSRIAAHVHDDAQPSRCARGLYLLLGQEWRNRRREVDAVDEDVNVEDFLEGAALGSLLHVPLEDVVPELSPRPDNGQYKNKNRHFTPSL